MEQPPKTTATVGTSGNTAAELLSRDSKFVGGVPAKFVSDVDMAERDGGCCAAKLDVNVVDGAGLKRKRGRAGRGVSKAAPPARQVEDEEDVCFICFDGGSLVLCDRRNCPKAYHPACVKRDEAFFRSKAKWNCGWHICSFCQKASHLMCYTCTYSLCKRCTKDADFVCIRGNKGLCGICMKTIMLIENCAQGNKCEVDFDDKSSWEYLFKVYWMYLKEKISLTFDEIQRAKKPMQENTFGARIIDAAANEGEAIDNDNKQSMLLNDKRCATSNKADVLVPQNNPDIYAAINTHNINLIYLRRSQMESLADDYERIRKNVVGSFVRIRISSGDQKQDMYRLVQVVGTSRVDEPYKIGTRTTDIKLEILNLNRKEVISIDEISNQEFSEDECKRLRQSIKYGLSKRLTVGEILDKALTLREIRVNDLLEDERSRLNHLRDRASEKGLKKELKECVEKLQLLNSQEERQRRLQDIPDIHSDPNLDSLFESDEDAGESDDSKQDGKMRSKCPGLDRRERVPIFSRICDGDLNDAGCKTQDLTTASVPVENTCVAKNLNPSDTAIGDSVSVVVKSEASSVAVEISSPLLSTGIEQPFNEYMNDRSWHYQDPSGKVQGPFSMLQLYKWNASGHFPPDLKIWRMDEKQDNCILLTDALNGKCSKNVSLPYNSLLLSLGASVTLDDKESSQNGGRNATRNEISADSQIIEQSREQKLGDTSTQSNGKDESVRSNGWPDEPHVQPSLPPTGFSQELNDNHTKKIGESHETEGNSENENHGSNRTSNGQNNNSQSYLKQSDNEDNSGKSSGQNWRHPNVNSSSNCLVTTSVDVSGTRTSPHKLGFDLHRPPSPPACNTTTWQAIIGEPDDFDESVSDLLAEVEAMESLGGLESPTSIMKRNEELNDSSKNDCLDFADLSPMLDAGKGDALSSTGDLHLPSQSTAAEEPLQPAGVHHHHQQRIYGEHASRNSEVGVGTKNIGVSSNQWEPGSENSLIFPTTLTLGMAVDTTWRLGSENTQLGWGGMDQRNANTGWGVGRTEVHENRSSNSYPSVITPGFGDSQTRYGSDRFSVPRDRGLPSHGRESGFARGRNTMTRQPIFGVGNGGTYRSLPKGQRVCKFYESGYCRKGASCDYLHP